MTSSPTVDQRTASDCRHRRHRAAHSHRCAVRSPPVICTPRKAARPHARRAPIRAPGVCTHRSASATQLCGAHTACSAVAGDRRCLRGSRGRLRTQGSSANCHDSEGARVQHSCPVLRGVHKRRLRCRLCGRRCGPPPAPRSSLALCLSRPCLGCMPMASASRVRPAGPERATFEPAYVMRYVALGLAANRHRETCPATCLYTHRSA